MRCTAAYSASPCQQFSSTSVEGGGVGFGGLECCVICAGREPEERTFGAPVPDERARELRELCHLNFSCDLRGRGVGLSPAGAARAASRRHSLASEGLHPRPGRRRSLPARTSQPRLPLPRTPRLGRPSVLTRTLKCWAPLDGDCSATRSPASPSRPLERQVQLQRGALPDRAPRPRVAGLRLLRHHHRPVRAVRRDRPLFGRGAARIITGAILRHSAQFPTARLPSTGDPRHDAHAPGVVDRRHVQRQRRGGVAGASSSVWCRTR